MYSDRLSMGWTSLILSKTALAASELSEADDILKRSAKSLAELGEGSRSMEVMQTRHRIKAQSLQSNQLREEADFLRWVAGKVHDGDGAAESVHIASAQRRLQGAVMHLSDKEAIEQGLEIHGCVDRAVLQGEKLAEAMMSDKAVKDHMHSRALSDMMTNLKAAQKYYFMRHELKEAHGTGKRHPLTTDSMLFLTTTD
jgi:hypothetical protein